MRYRLAKQIASFPRQILTDWASGLLAKSDAVISGSRESVLARFIFSSLTYDRDVAGFDGSNTVPWPGENPSQGKAIYLFAPVPSGALEPLVTVDTVMALFFSGIRGLRNRAREAVQLFAGNHAKSLKQIRDLSFGVPILPSLVVNRGVEKAATGMINPLAVLLAWGRPVTTRGEVSTPRPDFLSLTRRMAQDSF